MVSVVPVNDVVEVYYVCGYAALFECMLFSFRFGFLFFFELLSFLKLAH